MPKKDLPTLPSSDEWKSMTQAQQDNWLKTYGEEAGKQGMPAEALIGSSAQLNNLVRSYKGGDVSAAITVMQHANSEGEKSKKVVDDNAAAIQGAVEAGQKPAPPGGTKDQQDAAKAQAAEGIATKAGGGDDAKAKALAAIEALTSNVPDWVLSLTGGKTPTAQQKQKIIDNYNMFYKGSQLPDNVDDSTLWNTIDKAQSSDFAKALDNSLNSLHEQGKRYTFPTGDNFFLAGDRFKAAVDGYAASEQTIDLAVNMAHALGLSTGGAGPQDTMWQPILAIATALGKTGANVMQDIRSQQKAAPADQSHTYTGSIADKAKPGGGGSLADQATSGFVYNENLPGGMSVYDAAKKFQANLSTYNGDRGLALLATFNKGLADRFLANGRKFLDPNDVTAAAQVFIDSKWGNISDVGLASEKDANVVDAILQGDSSKAFDASSGSSGGRTVTLPDPEKVKQAADDMWEALFLSKAPAGWADSQVAAINAKVTGRSATDNDPKTNDTVTDTDPSAQILAALRNSPLYQTLYGKKQAGESEQDYANEHRAAAGSMLGSEAPDVAALQAGMESGQYQTTVGAVAGSARSMNNSTFMEKLARAAQAVNANT